MKKRLTKECIEKFKPTPFNPLRVECDDNYYINDMKEISFLSPEVCGEYAFLCATDSIANMRLRKDCLAHFPSPYQTKTKELHQWILEDENDVYVPAELIDDNGYRKNGMKHIMWDSATKRTKGEKAVTVEVPCE